MLEPNTRVPDSPMKPLTTPLVSENDPVKPTIPKVLVPVVKVAVALVRTRVQVPEPLSLIVPATTRTRPFSVIWPLTVNDQ